MKKILSIAFILGMLFSATEGIAGTKQSQSSSNAEPTYCKSLCVTQNAERAGQGNQASTACTVEALYKICSKCPDKIGKDCKEAFNNGQAKGLQEKSAVRTHCNPTTCQAPEVKKACTKAYEPLIASQNSKSGKEYEKQMLSDNCLAPDKAKPKTDKEKAAEAKGQANAKEKIAATQLKTLEAHLKKNCTPAKCEDVDIRKACFKQVDDYTANIQDKATKDKEDERLKQMCFPDY